MEDDESFPGAAASLLPTKDLTVDSRIENECGTSGREFFACPETGTSVYSLKITGERESRLALSRFLLVRTKNVVAVHPLAAKLSYQCVSGLSADRAR